MINHYLEILQISKDSFISIFDSLEDYSIEFPLQTIKCLMIISEKEIKSGFLVFENKYKEILKDILKSENEEAKKIAIKYINHLLKLNFHPFKDLLEDNISK